MRRCRSSPRRPTRSSSATASRTPAFATRPAFGALLLLGLVFSSLTLVWLTAYAFAVAKAGDFLRRSRVRRALDGVTGAVLVALGLRLATEQR